MSYFRLLTIRLFYPVPKPDPEAGSSPSGDPPEYTSTPTPAKKTTQRLPWRELTPHVLLLLLSGVLLSTIPLLLLSYQNTTFPSTQPLPATLSWLSAGSKLLLLIPLSEAISQSKWHLFTSARRKLSDLDHIDGASRNPLSALRWLLRFRNGKLVHLGAALMVLSLGFDPAVQQVLGSTPLTPVLDPSAVARLAANTQYRPARGFGQGLLLATPRSLLWGATAAVLGGDVETAYSCPSGECTFPPTTSVGICTVCTEETAQLDRNCTAVTSSRPFCSGSTCFSDGQLCSYRLNSTAAGSGETFLSLTATPGLSTPSASTVSIPSTRITLSAVFLQPSSSLAGTHTLPIAPGYVAPGTPHMARAYTCAVSYCEQTYSARVSAGVYTETHLGSTSLPAYVLPIPALSDINDALLNVPIALAETGATEVSTAALFALSNGLPMSLTGNATATVGTPRPGEVSEFHRGLYERLLDSSFNETMVGMARSMSAAIRNDADAKVHAWGQVYVDRVLVTIRWAWLAWPVGVWVGTAVMLAAVVARERKKGRMGWLGSSQVAGAFVGMEEEVRGDVERSVSWAGASEVGAFAEKVKVRVRRERGGWWWVKRGGE